MNTTSKLKTELLVALGELTVRFSYMEVEMKHFIGNLINMDDQRIGKIITSDMPFKPLWHALMSLYRHSELDKSLVKEFQTLLNSVEELESKRNNLIHSDWILSPFKIIKSKSTAKFGRGLSTEVREYKLTEIKHLNVEISKATRELTKFKTRWLTKHPSERIVDLLETIEFDS
jgi:hypothetical protein